MYNKGGGGNNDMFLIYGPQYKNCEFLAIQRALDGP